MMLTKWSVLLVLAVAPAAVAQCTTQWVPGGMLSGVVYALTELPNGDLVAGGQFTFAGAPGQHVVARWNGTAWSSMNTTFSGGVYALATMPNGDVVAAGDFGSMGGVNANFIARWDGTAWWPLGSGMTGNYVRGLAVLPSGDLVACGSFQTAGGVSVQHVARWDGAVWSSMGPCTADSLSCVLTTSDHRLLAAGSERLFGTVQSKSIYEWQGTSWLLRGMVAFDWGFAMAERNSGVVLAGQAGVDLWDGGSFTNVATGTSRALATLPDGDVAVGLPTTGFLSRWTGGIGVPPFGSGAYWSPFGSGTNGTVHALKVLRNGDLAVGGSFFLAGGNFSPAFARITTTCPAAVVAYGNGCTGAAGLLSLVADTLPWTDSTFRATAGPFAPNAFGWMVLGAVPLNIPVNALLPAALPGCNALTTIDSDGLLLPAGGVAKVGLFVPNVAALIGAVANVQIAQIEVDPQLQILAITTSNALRLTIGSF